MIPHTKGRLIFYRATYFFLTYENLVFAANRNFCHKTTAHGTDKRRDFGDKYRQNPIFRTIHNPKTNS